MAKLASAIEESQSQAVITVAIPKALVRGGNSVEAPYEVFTKLLDAKSRKTNWEHVAMIYSFQQPWDLEIVGQLRAAGILDSSKACIDPSTLPRKPVP